MADVEVPGAGKEYPLLWWTKWFDETWEEGKVVDYCGLPYTCRFTLDRSVYDETKVVIFQASRFKAHDVPSISDVKSGEKAWVLNTHGTLYTEYENVGRYKFYLSFENTSCNDYVSEKIGRPYDAGVVPIVDGPKDYSRFMATNHSLIRIDSFATPEQLAMRIHELDKDDAKYLTYLDYKTQPEDKPLDQFMMPEMLKTFDLPEDAWGPDDRGARCGVCKLAHDMSEGLYQFNPNKTIGVDTTCSFGKWAFNTWAIEFYA
ncbi:Alpha-(1,3)-fucosyltransferase 11, partial [Podila epigama]